MSGTGGRDLSECLDKFGNIAVDVVIGHGPGAGKRETGASAKPAVVARFLRDLAGDVQRLSAAADGRRQ